ncbi:MAG: SH3 domain-containing protein [Clostridia bacterium]|nr:SH3 domain-containing protein [Clostridia bacterium]
MSKKKLKITPQGYLVIASAAILLVAVIVIIVVLAGGGNSDPADINANTSPSLSATLPPTDATLAPQSSTAGPDTSALTSESSAAETNTPSPSPSTSTGTTQGTGSTTTVTPDPNALSAPTSEMVSNSVSGVLAKDNVNMRQGPSTSHSTVATGLKKGSKLTVYVLDNGWYFLKVDALDKYGYIRQDMVTLNGTLGGSTAVTEMTQPDGTVKGKITASALVLRTSPEIADDNKNGNYYKDQVVFIYYKESDTAGNVFYYVNIGGTDTNGYLCAKQASASNYMISAEGTVPDKP